MRCLKGGKGPRDCGAGRGEMEKDAQVLCGFFGAARRTRGTDPHGPTHTRPSGVSLIATAISRQETTPDEQ